MKRTFVVALVTFLFVSPSTLGSKICQLEDCVLSGNLHSVELPSHAEPPPGWMLHDLADARTALREATPTRAGRIATDTHRALSSKARDGADPKMVTAMHEALVEVLEAADWNAPEAPEAAGSN